MPRGHEGDQCSEVRSTWELELELEAELPVVINFSTVHVGLTV